MLGLGDISGSHHLACAPDEINRTEAENLRHKEDPQRAFFDGINIKSPAKGTQKKTAVTGKDGENEEIELDVDQEISKPAPLKVSPLRAMAKVKQDENQNDCAQAPSQQAPVTVLHKNADWPVSTTHGKGCRSEYCQV